MVVAVLCVVACLGVTSAFSARSGQDGGSGDFAIYVAPGTIATSASCNWVTIHTNVPFVDGGSASAMVDDEEVAIANTFPDERGNLVAKLKFADVVDIIVASRPSSPSAIVKLTLNSLSASKTVPVKG